MQIWTKNEYKERGLINNLETHFFFLTKKWETNIFNIFIIARQLNIPNSKSSQKMSDDNEIFSLIQAIQESEKTPEIIEWMRTITDK